MPVEEVFAVDILSLAVAAMVVPIIDSAPAANWNINFEPGLDYQIIEALQAKDGTSYGGLKYPLIAAVMPIRERSGSGFLEITFPRIVIAHLTKTGKNTEFVKEKYSSTGVLKTILRPCFRELMNRIAWSTYTNQGDPEAYEYTYRELLSQQEIADQLPNDFVEIIEVTNLKVITFHQIKTC